MGLNYKPDPDTKRFIEAVFEMPLEFVAAFERDRDMMADKLIADGNVKDVVTARTYATEILGRMVWMKVV